MLSTNLKIAWRHLKKNRTFSFINIAGLAVGITCALLMVFHVKGELSYDKGFPNADRLFRVTLQEFSDDPRHWAATSPPLAASLQQYFPGIETVGRFQRPYLYQLLSYGTTKRFEEKGGFFADQAVIPMFSMQFVHGDPATALTEMDAIVLTEKMAQKYFGHENPIGKVVQDDGKKLPLKVTGVVKSFPFATHVQFDYLLSMPTIIRYQDRIQMENRTWSGFYTYVQLKLPETIQFMQQTIQSLVPGGLFTYSFIDDRLNQLYASENRMSRVFKAFAVLAIFISCLGLFGLSAYSAQLRIKEIGIRKVLGASVRQVTVLLSSDFMLLVGVATIIAWPLAWYVMHQWLNGFAYRIDIDLWVFILSGCCALLLALVTVSFQAIKAALMNPIKNLRTEV